MMPFTFIIIFFATLAGCATTSNTTIQLPITINPLLQDGIQQGNITKFVHQINPTFFKYVTFSDVVKSLGHVSHVQLDKRLEGIVTLALASIGHGLTVDKFEFINGSKWTIVMSAEELASDSNITLPLDDKIRLVTIQKAMYKILEHRFNFKTEEIAERLNTTKEKIYAFLEPGWVQVVNFITEKNILALSTNYTIPPLYIAEALKMTLSELYNSTLPQLEDILVNKMDVIRAAAERWRRIVASSIAIKVTSHMTTVDAMESSSLAKMASASIAMTSSSKMGKEASIPPRTSQMTESTQHLLEITKGSLSPLYLMKTSTNTKYQQSTNILKRSPAFTQAADRGTWKTYSAVNLNSYHASSSYYEDIDECSRDSNSCSANSECKNTIGSFTCPCNSGYVRSGSICKETSREPSQHETKWYIFAIISVAGIVIGLSLAYVAICLRRRYLKREAQFNSTDVQHSYHNSFYELDVGKLGDDNFYETVGTATHESSPPYDELGKVRDPENTYESLK